MKFCVNCKHHIHNYLNSQYENYDKCRISEQVSVNLVTGEEVKVYRYCTTMRSPGELCDAEGKLYTAKAEGHQPVDSDEHSPYFPN